MYTARINSVKPGMVLADSVSNLQGVLLLAKGTVLKQKNILMLKAWGIMEVALEGQPEKEENAKPQAEDQKKSIENILMDRFYGTLDDEVMVEVMNVSASLLYGRLLKENEVE
jgi:hypothetical protein